MKLGGSIAFQLIDIFSIIENPNLNEEQKKLMIKEYQNSLQIDIKNGGRGILLDPINRSNGQSRKNGYYMFGDIDVMSYEDLLKTKEYVDKYLTSFTCENEMKMTSIINGYDKEKHEIIYNFGFSDKVYNYAREKGKDVRGHTLVWHNHQPKALDMYIEDKLGCSMEEYEKKDPDGFKEKRREYTLKFLGDYFEKMNSQYPDCYCWDVINEIVPDMHTQKPTDEERESGLRVYKDNKKIKWNEYIGQDEKGNDYYIEILKLAREKMPNKKLFYNEYGEQYPEKRKAILNVINKIKDYEEKNNVTLLDGIGLQSHYDLNVTPQQIEQIYDEFISTGKEIQVTEMDVAPGRNEKGENLEYNPDNIEQYSKIWNKVFEMCDKHGIKSFTGWGVNDSLSWYRNIGCTMVDKKGNIKEFAKNYIEGIFSKNLLNDVIEYTKETIKMRDINEQKNEIMSIDSPEKQGKQEIK